MPAFPDDRRSRSPRLGVKREPEDARREDGRRVDSPDRFRRRDSRSPRVWDDRRGRRSWSRSRSPRRERSSPRADRGRNSPRHDDRRKARSRSPKRRSRWDRDSDVTKEPVDEIAETIPCVGFEGRIIGKGGEQIKKIQRDTGARITIDREKGVCVVSGSAEQVVLASESVRDAMKSSGGGGGSSFVAGNSSSHGAPPEAEATIHVSGFEGKIIGKGGEQIRKLQSESGARIKIDSTDGTAVVRGLRAAVEKACDAINALMDGGDDFRKEFVKREDDGDDGGGVYGPKGAGGGDGLADDDDEGNEPELPPPVAPDFGLSGALAKETNTVNGVTLVYNEPMDKSPAPKTKWRLYVFKDGQLLTDSEPLRVYGRSYYLFGRDRAVADIPTDHPSCSKQHAVLQYRTKHRYDDDLGMEVTTSTPYLMCLEATNGTFINNDRLEPRRYYQLLEKDLVKFGTSTREYVLLSEDARR